VNSNTPFGEEVAERELREVLACGALEVYSDFLVGKEVGVREAQEMSSNGVAFFGKEDTAYEHQEVYSNSPLRQGGRGSRASVDVLQQARSLRQVSPRSARGSRLASFRTMPPR